MSDYLFNPILHSGETEVIEKRTRRVHDECKCDSTNDDDFYSYKDSRIDVRYVRRTMCKKCYSKYQMNLRKNK